MKKAILYLSVPLFWLITNASSCRTDPPCDCKGYADISNEMKAYVNFQKGDYWVYRLKQDTTVVDTLYCDRLEKRENDCGSQMTDGNAIACSYLYRLALIHSNADSFPHSNLKPGQGGAEVFTAKVGSTKEVLEITTRKILKVGTDGHAAGGPIFWLPFNVGEKYTKTEFYQIAGQNLDVGVADNLFRNCILTRFQSYYDVEVGKRTLDSIYLSPGIGIVKYNLDTTGYQTWELIKYQIKK